MGSTDLALSWKDHHGVLFNVFEKLLAKKSLVDCTLAAEGKFLKAHRIVLSACSPYFEALLDQEHDKHPIIFLRDVQFEDLKTLLEFVYSGEIKIPENRLVEFLNVAEALQIKGLGGVGNEGQVNKSSTDVLPQRETRSPVPRKRTRRHSSSSDGSSRDRAEIIPVSSESSRPKSNSEKIVPVANNASTSEPVPRQTSVVPSEDLNPNVKVKEEIITPVQSTCSDLLSSDQSADNEEILGLKPEFEQVTFTEDYSDDMLPEDSDSVDHVIDQDQPSSSQQYSGFSAESAKAGELSIHPPFAVGGVNQPVPEGCGSAQWSVRARPRGALFAECRERDAARSATTSVGSRAVDSIMEPFSNREEINPGHEGIGSSVERYSLKMRTADQLRNSMGIPSHTEVTTQVKSVLRVASTSWNSDANDKEFESSGCDSTNRLSKYGTKIFDGGVRLGTAKDIEDTSTPSETKTYEDKFEDPSLTSETEKDRYSMPECVKCRRSFLSKQGLERHMQLHIGDKPFACQFCAMTFRQSGNLRKHIVTHTGERPYVCTVCGQGFTQSNALHYHVSAKHTGERPFACPQPMCDRRFIRSTALKRHLKVHARRTGTGQESSPPRDPKASPLRPP